MESSRMEEFHVESKNLLSKLFQVRSEMHNIRKQVEGTRRALRKDVLFLKKLLEQSQSNLDKPESSGSMTPKKDGSEQLAVDHVDRDESTSPNHEKNIQALAGRSLWDFQPIGYVSSVFQNKNGTPRQSGICSSAKGTLTISASVFSNPEHSLANLQQFSHVWVLFLFHKNNKSYCKAKVKPPRLNGAKVGLFSTRSPYRPNAIGLSLCKLDSVEGGTLHLSGVDIVDGTPVLDIKPYIAMYDQPAAALPHVEPCEAFDSLCASQDVVPANDCSAEADVCVPDNDDVGDDKLLKKDDQETDKRDTGSLSGLAGAAADTPSRHVDSSAAVDQSMLDTKFSVRESRTCDKACSEVAHESYAQEPPLPVGKTSSSETDIIERDTNVKPLKEITATELVHSSSMNECRNTLQQDAEDTSRTECQMGTGGATMAHWLVTTPKQPLEVIFTERAKANLAEIYKNGEKSPKYLSDVGEAMKAISDILRADPRSWYRRKSCQDRLYYFIVDTLHLTCWFDGDLAEVLKVDQNFPPSKMT